MAASDKQPAAAYIPWATFKNALDQLSQAVPNHIDRSVFPGFAWSIQNQLFASLKFLGLMEPSGRPTVELAALVAGDEQQRKMKFQELLQSRYQALFDLDLTKTTPDQLANKMGEAHGVTGDTRDKAVRFFVSAAEYAGVQFSPLFNRDKRPGNGGAPARSTANRRSPRQRRSGEAAANETNSPEETRTQERGGRMWEEKLLEKFPQFDPQWPDELKAKWFQGFERLMKAKVE